MEGRTRRRQISIISQNTTSSSDNQSMNNTGSDSSSSANDISHVSETEMSNNTSRSSQSSDTEPYDVDEEMARVATNNDNPVIVINDSQIPNNAQDDDDDVILIPQNMETIDLCTQAVSIPLRLRNEIIDITDSPGTENSNAGPIRRLRNRQPEYVNDNPASVLQRPTTSTPITRKRLDLDDSLNDSQPKITLTCPICLDSVVNRTPVSTLCGHIFCQTCITQALKSAKKCPMCKKALGGRKQFFNIFLPC